MTNRAQTFLAGLLLSVTLISSLFANKQSSTDHSLVFPTTGLLPKTEIGALAFLEENPKADGRGVIVAVLDTGVDPGAPGMQFTTTGEPKLLAVIDATGSGDVVTTTIKQENKGVLEGLSGRQLKIGKSWKNPSGDFRLGMVAAYDLFPEELVARLEKERKEDWDAEQRELERTLQAKIDIFKAKNPDLDSDQKETLADLEKQLEVAKGFAASYQDPGPIYDCVVFNDGKIWRVVVDTDADGDLAEEKVLTNFDIEHEYGTFGDDSLMNFAVNVYNDGDLLSIVADTGMHGTHVAGIVGAYFEDQQELNGVAPGAQIVSIKIGDTRLGGMETPHALSRAAIAIKKYGCDMVNMSYGEAIRFPTEGNLIEKLSSLVDDHNVVYVSSAGNSGPALTTVGAPGGTTSPIIGVGATITPALMKTSYSLLKDLPTNQFTWSSRGPTIDGDLGVDISAPGGAISPVPRWELTKNMRANGTSMAGPDACGGLALVLSALKQQDKAYTAAWVKRAATHAAKTIPTVDVFGQGHGMLQVGATYDILVNLPDSLLTTPRFDISVGGDHARGIYLRNGDLPERQTFGISVKAKFPEDTDKVVEADFEARYVLSTDATWVTCPDFAFVNSLNKRFDVQLNLADLEPGVYYSEVVATDANYPAAGPVFRIPITVVKPTELETNEWISEETLSPGEIQRFFFQVPAGATWAEFKVEAPEVDEPTTLVVHPQHTIPGERYVNVGDSYYLGVSKDHPRSTTFAVEEGSTMELAIAQYWSELETANFELELKFHGLQTELGDGVYVQGDKGEEFRVVSLVENTRLSPSASFTQLERSVSASSAEISVNDGDRDQLDEDGEAYHQLVLEYPFEIAEDASVTPVLSMLNDKIYEVEFESQLQMIYDANRQLIVTNDTFPDPVSLTKGDYVLRLQLRHKDRSVLEKLKTLNLTLAIDLADAISVGTYDVTDHALLQNGAGGSGSIEKNRRSPLVVLEPELKKLPEFAQAGDRLVGSLTLQSGAPVSIPLQWVYTGEVFEEPEEKDEIELPENSLEEDVSEALIKLAAKYREDEKKEAFDQLLNTHLVDSNDAIGVALEKLRWHVDTDENGESSSQIKTAAQAVLDLVDEDALARYFGRNQEIDDVDSKVLENEMKKQKSALAEAYGAIASASCKSSDDLETVQSHLDNLKAWVDADDIDLDIQKTIFEKKGFNGEILALLNQAIQDDVTDKDSYAERIELIEELGWDHLVKYEKDWMLRKFPSEYAPF